MHDIAYLDTDKPAFTTQSVVIRQTNEKKYTTIAYIQVDTNLDFRYSLGGNYNTANGGMGGTEDGNSNTGNIFHGVVEWYVN